MKTYYSSFLIVLITLTLYSTIGENAYASINGKVEVDGSQKPTTILNVQTAGRHLAVTAELPETIQEVEIRIESDRNKTVTKFYDVSPHHPGRENLKQRYSDVDRNVWYPVVDVVLEPGMEAVAQFNGGPAIYTINSMFYKEEEPFTSEIVIPSNKLEYWENGLFVLPSTGKALEEFYLRQPFRSAEGGIQHVYELLTEDWSGVIAIYSTGAEGGRKLAEARIKTRNSIGTDNPLERFRGEGLLRARLLESLKASVDFTLRSQNQNPDSPTYGGLNMLYDLDGDLYRTSYWMWSWGPSVRLLVDATQISGLDVRPDVLMKSARQIADASIRFQVNFMHHPADGLVAAGWTQGIMYEKAHENFRISAGPDALHMAGWGWGELYNRTQDRKYLEAFEKLAGATERLMNEYELLPQLYLPGGGLPIGEGVGMDQTEDGNNFGPKTIDEAMFGMEGYAEFYRITGNEWYKTLGKTFIEQFVSKLEMENGSWATGWNRLTGKRQGSGHSVTRAMAWVMEGLLAAHRLLPEDGYLEKAKRYAQKMIEAQHETGYWKRQLDRPLEITGISEKSTAIWSYLFYQLYKESGDEQYLTVARKALMWCLENQYTGPDREAYGSIIGRTNSSGIGYRPWFDISCVYTSAFFGLAVMEELSL